LLRDPLGFRAPVGRERAADIDLPAGELSFFPAPDVSLVAVRFDQLAWHDGLPGVRVVNATRLRSFPGDIPAPRPMKIGTTGSPFPIVARAVSSTRAATSTRFAAATIVNPIADTRKHIDRKQFGMGRTVRAGQLRTPQQECAHVDPHPLFRASKYHCCSGLQPDRRRPPEGDN